MPPSTSRIIEKNEISQRAQSKEQSKKRGTDEVFNAALIGGLAGAAAGIGLVALLELMKESGKGE